MLKTEAKPKRAGRWCLLGGLSVVLTFFFVSCEEKPPIPEQKMESLLTDLFVTNVAAPYPEADTVAYLDLYADLYRRAECDSLLLDSALRYYAAHPLLLDEVLDRVIARMQQRLDSLEVALDREETMLMKAPLLEEEAVE